MLRRHIDDMRPAVVLKWKGGVYTADIVMAFNARGADTSSPLLLVQWHREVCTAFDVPVRLSTLSLEYSILPSCDIVRQLLILPQFGNLKNVGCDSDCVIALSLKQLLSCG